MASKSRRNKSSIMAHRGFGDVVIIKNGMRVTIPQDSLEFDGSVPKKFLDLINDRLTVSDAVVLHKMQGVTIEKADNNNLLGGM
jgi:hypothetical protein